MLLTFFLCSFIDTTTMYAKSMAVLNLQQVISGYDEVIAGQVEEVNFINKTHIKKCEYLELALNWEMIMDLRPIFPKGKDGFTINTLEEYIDWMESSDNYIKIPDNGSCGAIYKIKTTEILKGTVKNKYIHFYSTSSFTIGRKYVFFLNETNLKLPTIFNSPAEYKSWIERGMGFVNERFYIEFSNDCKIPEECMITPHNFFIQDSQSKNRHNINQYSWINISDYIKKLVRKDFE